MISKEYQAIVEAYSEAGGDANALRNGKVGSIVIHENRVLNASEVSGLKLKSIQSENGVTAELLVEKGKKIENPVHLCFGILPKEGLQEIIMKVDIQDGGEVDVVAHCIFPNAVKVIHKMDANIKIGEGAKFRYQETHYHGEFGGIEVIPKAKVEVGRKGLFQSTFSLIKGSVGLLDFDYDVFCDEESVTELAMKVYGKKDDEIKVSEKTHLNGKGARSLIKSRLVLKDRAKAEIMGETYGNAPFTRGHVDCTEIVNGKGAIAKAMPFVSVSDPQAKVTHEAAIGSIDKKQLDTLMARGLSPDEAVDVIVTAMLK